MANTIPFVYPPASGDLGDVLARINSSQYVGWVKPDVRVNPITGKLEQHVGKGIYEEIQFPVDGGEY